MISKLIPTIPAEVNEEFKSVVLTDTVENINIFENLLKQLDVKTPQIQIEAKMVEIKLDTNEKYGVNWTWSDIAGGSLKELKSFLENFQPADSRMQLQLGSLRVDDFNAILTFLLTQTNTDLLSSPKIVTMNGKEASINTSDQIPIKSQTISGNTIIVTTVFKEVGVKLRVTPSIKDENFILLDVHPEVNEVLDYSVLTGDPIISTRKMDGSIIIKDNETLMIGGLLKNKSLVVESKLPILGDIPLLGILFKKTSTERTKTEIIIFLTPHIIKEGEKLIAPEDNILGR
jgi:general secretion pathway protein D